MAFADGIQHVGYVTCSCFQLVSLGLVGWDFELPSLPTLLVWNVANTSETGYVRDSATDIEIGYDK